MLSEVNLLPQREQKSLFFIIGLIILLAVGLIASALLFATHMTLTLDKTREQSQLNVVQKQIEEQNRLLQQVSEKTDMQQYADIVNAVAALPVQTVGILDEMSAALPKNGLFTSYTYEDSGKISLLGKFGSLEDTVQYVHQLTYSDWVQSIIIGSISKQEDEKFPYHASYEIELKRQAFTRAEGDEAK